MHSIWEMHVLGYFFCRSVVTISLFISISTGVESLILTLSRSSIHCSHAPLQGRGQWWNMLQFHDEKMNDFAIHLYSLEIRVVSLISFVGFIVNISYLGCRISLKLLTSQSFSWRGRNMVKSEDQCG